MGSVETTNSNEENEMQETVISIYGSAKRGFFLYAHKAGQGPGSIPAAGPYATKAEAKRKYRLSYSQFKAWNF